MCTRWSMSVIKDMHGTINSTCRSCVLLCLAPARYILAVTCFGSVLVSGISFWCKTVQRFASNEIHSPDLCSDRCSCTLCSHYCHHIPVCPWQICNGSSKGWPWIWNHSFSFIAVQWKGRENNILCSCTSHHCHHYDWNDLSDTCIQDHTQGELL